MKFIFPQNYDFKNKIFGIIDYSTAIINVIWFCLLLIIVNIIFNDLNIKIFLLIIFCFPVILFSYSGFNGENIVYVFIYMINFMKKQKKYFYSKLKS